MQWIVKPQMPDYQEGVTPMTWCPILWTIIKKVGRGVLALGTCINTDLLCRDLEVFSDC
jgi:hypothetical protein